MASFIYTATRDRAPEWMYHIEAIRQRLFLIYIEPVIVTVLGPVQVEPAKLIINGQTESDNTSTLNDHRRLLAWPDFAHYGTSTGSKVQETTFSFATLIMLVLTLNCVFLIFLSCFYHNQKTCPLFISPRRHRLPKLVPPPLPVDGYFSWVKVCLFLSDEEILNRIGYDSLIFIRFHRLALRCIVKMSVFSFIVLLPLNFTGSFLNSSTSDFHDMIFYTDFMLFTMANIKPGSPRLWAHCFAAYLLTGIVVRELLVEYETFNSIRHRYLLSREPHLRTVLVTNIPRHLRSSGKISSYFRHVYPNAVHSVFMCQNLIALEALIRERTMILSRIEKELLMLCRNEKRKLYESSWWNKFTNALQARLENEPCCICYEVPQERITNLYIQLEDMNNRVEAEQNRRRRVMKMLDHMEAGEGAGDIDYVLASPFIDGQNAQQRRVMGLPSTDEPSTRTTTLSTKPSSSRYHSPPIMQPNDMSQAMMSYQQQQQQQQQRPSSIPEVNEDENDNGASTLNGNGIFLSITDLRSRSSVVSASGVAESNLGSYSQEQQEQLHHHQQQQQQQQHAAVVQEDGDYEMIKENSLHLKSSRIRKGLRSFVRAKQAIRRYGRFNHQDFSFLGRPINRSLTNNPPSDKVRHSHIEDHINEVTDKAFVIMRTFTAATIAIQSMHSSKPGSMQVTTAPEPRDILWKNIYVSKGAHRTRSYLGEILVLIIILFYAFPVLLISFFTSDVALKGLSPRLAQLAQASSFFSAAIALVQPLCIVGLQQLLPPLFMFIGEAEGILSFSEVQMRAFSRYFLFQVINVFLVTTIAGSVFDTIARIIESPEFAFETLGNSLPRLSSFFITFVTIKTFLALGFELVRTMSLFQATIRYFVIPNATLRTQRTVILGMRAIDDPGWFPFHKILAQDMLVVVVSVVFAVVAPLVLVPCAVFCLYSRIMWTHHHLYVYESVFESGGQFWPKIFRRFIFGLIIAQMTIAGQLIVKDARHEAYATIALMFFTYFFLRSTRARYDATSSSLPLEVATVMDISLHQEELEQRHHQQQQQLQYSDTDDPAKNPEPLDPGAMIGRFDPFRRAYQQPSLRAIPRARPEQPFPAAQLGPETTSLMMRAAGRKTGLPTLSVIGTCGLENDNLTSEYLNTNDPNNNESVWQDSGATVQLKHLNQQDRRSINRWWNDQLQRAGEQNIVAILTGEECGTLTLSNHHLGHPTKLDDHFSVARSHHCMV